METENAPPPIPVSGYKLGNYPDPNRPIGKAWAAAWAELVSAGAQFVDGTELAERAAATASLKPTTLITLLTRAANANLLERAHKTVAGARGPRSRTHYRIPQEG